jgi:hypothetical protein
MKILMQGTNISNVGIRVSQQLAIGGASLQPNFSRSMFVQETGGNIVVNIVFQVLPQQLGLMSQPTTNQFSNTSHKMLLYNLSIQCLCRELT